MTTLTIEYDEESGQVTGWRYEADDGYVPDANELVADEEKYDHRDISRGKFVVDTSAEPPELVENPDYDPRPPLERVEDEADSLKGNGPVQRQKVSEQSKQDFRDARSNDDLQTQLDILFEIVTGEEP